jgi:hypothetical protein
MAVGAGVARAVGVNLFPPVGLMLFSVGAGRGSPGVTDCVLVVVVVGGWVVDGAFEPLPLQLAIDAANPARTATPPTTRARRAESELFLMTSPIDSVCLIADSPQRLWRKRLVARFIGAPVVAVGKLADSARSVFTSAGWKSNFTDLTTGSGLYCHVGTQNGDGPFGFEDGQMNTVGVGVPVFAQHRL